MSTNRYRSTSTEWTARARQRTWDWNPTTQSVRTTTSVDNQNFVFAKVGDFSDIRDEAHPGYARRRARGALIFGDLYMVKRRHPYAEVTLSVPPTKEWGRMEVTGPLPACACDKVGRGTGTLDADIARAKSIALTKAYAKMNESPLLTGEFLSDLNQTVSMLKRPFRTSVDLLARMAKYKKQRLGKTVASAAKATTDTWLEFRYGWKPLLSDMDTIVDETHRKLARPSQRIVFRASELLSNTSNKTSGTTVGTVPTLGASVRSTAVCTAGVHAGVMTWIASMSASDSLLKTLGLRPRDLAATVWEVLPFSFVVDWFANVGPWLQAISPAPEIIQTVNWVTVVKKTSFTGVVTLTYGPVNSYGSICTASGTDLFDETSITRVVNGSLPSTPVLTTRPLSKLQMADALSLSAQQIHRALTRL